MLIIILRIRAVSITVSVWFKVSILVWTTDWFIVVSNRTDPSDYLGTVIFVNDEFLMVIIKLLSTVYSTISFTNSLAEEVLLLICKHPTKMMFKLIKRCSEKFSVAIFNMKNTMGLSVVYSLNSMFVSQYHYFLKR